MSQPFRIVDFTSEIGNRGFANPSYYTVEIFPPVALSRSSTQDSAWRNLPLRIETAALPSRQILTHDLRTIGPIRKVPYAYTTQPFTIRIILSETMYEREFFQSWQDLILGQSRKKDQASTTGTFDTGFYDDATQDAQIVIKTFGTSPKWQTSGSNRPERSLFGELTDIARAVGFDPSVIPGVTRPTNQNRTISEAYKVTLLRPFPTIIQEVPLSWSSSENYAHLDVIFDYHYAQEENLFYRQENEVTVPEGRRSLAESLRQGVNALNRFRPVVAGIRSGGFVSSITNNARVAIGSVNPFR